MLLATIIFEKFKKMELETEQKIYFLISFMVLIETVIWLLTNFIWHTADLSHRHKLTLNSP